MEAAESGNVEEGDARLPVGEGPYGVSSGELVMSPAEGNDENK